MPFVHDLAVRLAKRAWQTEHEVGEPNPILSDTLTIESELAVHQERSKRVQLLGNEVGAEPHLMPATNNVDILADLQCSGVEVAGEIGSSKTIRDRSQVEKVPASPGVP